ncbi:DUF3515 domain-containing protein [Streptomyces bambusae]|uniref:DUF3515 domain-containing protein n=1 Tax=Streptomyces bambusae TaxID=1550616 RepID=UPI001CFCD720|nr:DUF3515 domain-containing protein [Streptomyces bambusae]MCB5168571.1 DUF3515 domain-containing protein [Streptomyces bambusae]
MTFFRRRPFLLLPASAAALLAALAGCSSGDVRAQVEPPPAPPADVAELCAALHGELPETVAGEDRSATVPASGLTAAWGGGAIVLRCGIPKPVDLILATATTGQVEVNGVGWLIEKQRADGSFRFVTGGRQAYVEVVVDKAHATDAGLLVPLGPAIAKAIPAGSSLH